MQLKEFYEFGPYRLYPAARVLLRDGTNVPLTPKVLDTLKVLVRNAGQPVSKEELLRTVWPDTFVEESNLAQNISVLRKALGTAPATDLILKRWRRGDTGLCREFIWRRPSSLRWPPVRNLRQSSRFLGSPGNWLP